MARRHGSGRALRRRNSDTGYILLGLALERIERRPYGKDGDVLAVTARGVDLSDRNAMSVDWAGGGVVTATSDLVTFIRAFTSAEIVSAGTLARLTDFEHEYEKGIHYGMGVMQFRFRELSPLLFSMPDAYGAVGATGTFALYDPAGDRIFVANYGSLEFGEKAIEELVGLRMILPGDRVRRARPHGRGPAARGGRSRAGRRHPAGGRPAGEQLRRAHGARGDVPRSGRRGDRRPYRRAQRRLRAVQAALALTADDDQAPPAT
ncbi:hypothetical protein CLV67_13144 [Actinoplanes italicus]|uniref:Beta-lactamase n=1 Tax=Actinoplanes italicus TaxID=113567 RepID=A0A2T0JV05_9ACTN|nr:hypothetical protein CLV67_13144 [Actinoplanes italicus]